MGYNLLNFTEPGYLDTSGNVGQIIQSENAKTTGYITLSPDGLTIQFPSYVRGSTYADYYRVVLFDADKNAVGYGYKFTTTDAIPLHLVASSIYRDSKYCRISQYTAAIENGMANYGSSIKPYEPYQTLEGSTYQDGVPTPEDPKDIKSALSFEITITDASGAELEKRTITPPYPLNKLGTYADKADIEGGNWTYSCDSFSFNDGEIRIGTIDTSTYRGRASFRFMKYNADKSVRRGYGICNNLILSNWATSAGEISNGPIGYGTGFTTNGNLLIDSDDVSVEDISAHVSDDIIMICVTEEPTTEPINPEDLAFLQSLFNYPASQVTITPIYDAPEPKEPVDTRDYISYGTTTVEKILAYFNKKGV